MNNEEMNKVVAMDNSITLEQFVEIMKDKERRNIQLYSNEHNGMSVNMIVERTEFFKEYKEIKFSNKQSNFTIDTERIEDIEFNEEDNKITMTLDCSVQELIIELHKREVRRYDN